MTRQDTGAATRMSRMTRLLDRLAPARRLEAFAVRHANLTFRDRRTGHRIPLVGGLGSRRLAATEPQIAWAIGRLLARRGGTFVDVGANLGQTLLKVKSADPQRRYVGFDVQAASVFYLQRLIAANDFPACTVVPVGLGLRDAAVPLLYNAVADSCATTDPAFRGALFYRNSTIGVVRNGDAMLAEIGVDDAAIVKIEVEGGEADVIEGLSGTIRATRPCIICEILPTGHVTDPDIALHRQGAMQRIERLLGAHGYHVNRILPAGSLEPAMTFESVGFDLDLCNYLFSPETLAPDLR